MHSAGESLPKPAHVPVVEGDLTQREAPQPSLALALQTYEAETSANTPSVVPACQPASLLGWC